jgi:WD40 repeat protein
MKAYIVPISSSALHVYDSGLVSMPWCTLSTGVSHPSAGRLVSQRDHQWSAGPMLLEGHTNWIRSVTFSPDGLQIISGFDDRTVRVWDAVSGVHKHTLEGHTNSIFSVAFSPDSSQIISGSADGTVRVWDVAMLDMRYSDLAGGKNSRNASECSSDDSQAPSGSLGQSVRVRSIGSDHKSEQH